MKTMKILCMIPTFNEAENIKDLISEILKIKINNNIKDANNINDTNNINDVKDIYDINVLVVDDDSPDGTWKIVKEIVSENKKVHLLHRTKNKGRGYSGRAGFKWALENNYDAVIEMDADFSHHPRHIPDLLKGLENADMVLGSRMVSGGKDLRKEWARRNLTKLANLYIRLVLGIKVRDCNSGYRAYTRKALEKINVNKLFAEGPLTVQEILYRAKLAGLKIREVPIIFIEREKGESTLTLKKIWQGYSGVVKLRLMRMFGKI